MSIRLGVSPIAWSNDDLPELGGDTPLTTCLGDASALGFSGIELGHKFPLSEAPLREVLDHYNLDLIGGWFSGHLLSHGVAKEIDRLQQHMKLLKAFGCRVFIYAECSNTIHSNPAIGVQNKPVLSGHEWRRFGERLSDLARYLKDQGLSLAYHHHAGTVVETDVELERFTDVTDDAVGLVLDTGHAFLGGIDPRSTILARPERIVHVHCKDVRASVLNEVRNKNKSFLEGVVQGMFTVPGDGAIRLEPIMSALRQIRYQGWIVIEAEQDPAAAPPREYAERGLASVRAAARVAALTIDETVA